LPQRISGNCENKGMVEGVRNEPSLWLRATAIETVRAGN
jgi:hypothetical protein